MGQSLTRSLFLPDEAATRHLAEQLALQLPADTAGWRLLLQGELGTGKSTLARALIQSLGHDGPVPSPTYTLIEPYVLSIGPVYHVDLYRIGSDEELEFLGWDELGDGLALIEWPERAPALLSQADICIEMRYAKTGRDVALRASSDRGAAWLGTLTLTEG